MQINSMIRRLFGTIGLSPSDDACAFETLVSLEKSPVNLDTIRHAMLRAVAPCSEPHRMRATYQVRVAKTGIELWMLRADIFQYLAQDLGQMEAARQITELMPLFKDTVPGATDRPGTSRSAIYSFNG